jgi:hypothetical protein
MRGLKARSITTNKYKVIVAFMPNHRAGFQPFHFLRCLFLGLRPRLGSNAPLALKAIPPLPRHGQSIDWLTLSISSRRHEFFIRAHPS